MTKPTIFAIIGKSGSGKDTIEKKVLDLHINNLGRRFRLNRLIPITTRERRTNEINGTDYFFVSDEKFNQFIKDDSLLNYQTYHVFANNGKRKDTYYGYPSTMEDYSITIYPYPVYREIFNNRKDVSVIPIFINVEDSELLYRLMKREIDNKGNIKEAARRFIADMHDYPSEASLKIMAPDGYFENANADVTANKVYQYICSTINKIEKTKNIKLHKDI